jgi:glycosyltransferase involved in cell wall biosynthesis
MSSKPKVSVVTITYNHEKYIRHTLDSFMMQQVDFPFEVVIADDASTDNTQAIIKEYEQKYPSVIHPILRKKNMGAVQNSLSSLQAATGEYIALCEGDDYWTDPSKLQIQADFLDAHKAYALCFHPVKVFFENHEKKSYAFPESKENRKFNISELLKSNFIQTNSVMYRKQKYDNLPQDILPLDWYLHLYHAQFGKIGFVNKAMAAYRRHEGGLWWEASKKNRAEFWRKHGIAHMRAYEEILKLYPSKTHQQIIKASIFNALSAIIQADSNGGGHKLLSEIQLRFPQFFEEFITDLSNRNSDFQSRIIDLQESLTRQSQQMRLMQQREKELAAELESIHNSKSWQYVKNISKARAKIISKKTSK